MAWRAGGSLGCRGGDGFNTSGFSWRRGWLRFNWAVLFIGGLRGRVGFGHAAGMSEVVPSTGPVIPAVSWDADVIFPLLADPVRRRLLLAVARGGGQPASVLKDAANRRLDATLKHLTALRAAGLLVTRPDKQDGRRMLYGLAPGVPLVMAPEGAVLDFGFCVLRLKG